MTIEYTLLLSFYTFIAIDQLAYSTEISYNLPNLSSCATWDPNSITFAEWYFPIIYVDGKLLRSNLQSVFIDRNNSIYVTYPDNYTIHEWHNSINNDSVKIITRHSYKPYELFVSTTGDIYISSLENKQIEKWVPATSTIEARVQFCEVCYHIFIATDDMLYCSMSGHEIVAKRSIQNSSNIIIVVAGVGVFGSETYMLDSPRGIFVNTNFDLYVADAGNDRVQLFRSGEINGITIVGTLDTYELFYPTSVVLDVNNQLYIVDSGNIRIIRQTRYGFHCIIGCSESSSSYDKLDNPTTMAFDSFGNIYIVNADNRRVAKFLLLINTCNSTNATTVNVASISIATSTPTLIESKFTSTLTTDSSKTKFCSNLTTYYDNTHIRIFKEGIYNFLINSTIDVGVHLYKNYFDDNILDENLLFTHYTGCDLSQMKFSVNLESNEKYDLVITTSSILPNTIYSYSVVSSGPTNVSFNHMNISRIMETVYSSEFTLNSSVCYELLSIVANVYCEAIKIDVTETAQYTIVGNSKMKILGYAYENNFTIFDLEKHAIERSHYINNCDEQFRIVLHRQMNTSFILVISTRYAFQQGKFSIVISGPSNISIKKIDDIPPVIESNYSSELNNKSQKHDHLHCYSLDYYYKAIEIVVNTSGYYNFISNSDFDACGYLYERHFDWYDPEQTLLSENDNYYGKKNFKITEYLNSGFVYVIVITTSYKSINVQGAFSVIISGPEKISMKEIGTYIQDDTLSRIVQSVYQTQLTENSPQHPYKHDDLDLLNYHYETVQINVIQSGNYSLSSLFNFAISGKGYLYIQHFNSNNRFKRLLFAGVNNCSSSDTFRILGHLSANVTYILVISGNIWSKPIHTNVSILVTGLDKVIFYRISLQATYQSELTEENQVYPRVCGTGNYHYETIGISVLQSGSYTFDSNSTVLLYGYIYKNSFNPSYPNENLITESNFTNDNRFNLGDYLEINTLYILVVTTFDPKVRGPFRLFVTGPNNITLNRIVDKHSSCVVGDQCNLYTRGIGLTINDILRNQIQSDTSFRMQSALIHAAVGITMIMFLIGFVNATFSLMTFRDKQLRKIGCGIYLLASSITSLLTISMFTIKFWFVVLVQFYSTFNSSVLRTDCLFIGPVLKLCLYLDGWLNACVAIERAVNVSKGVNFDKKRSVNIARRIILILPILIACTIIHEPIHHDLFEYTIQKYRSIPNNYNSTMNISMESAIKETFEYVSERRILCVIRYSPSVQNYNIITLFFHLIIPFIANFFSAFFIIFGTARRRSTAQNNQTLKEHVLKQINEHRQLLISPSILFILAVPRLIMSLLSGCVDPSSNPWLYLCSYFISFMPPMLIFAVFVLPSELYTKTFKESLTRWRRQIRQ